MVTYLIQILQKSVIIRMVENGNKLKLFYFLLLWWMSHVRVRFNFSQNDFKILNLVHVQYILKILPTQREI